MANYNCFEAMKEDVRQYITDEIAISEWEDREELEQHLNDTLWTVDSVTGNATAT